MKGNLGDILHASVLLRALRALQPDALDVAGYPPQPPPSCREGCLDVADRFLPESFEWWWSLLPGVARGGVQRLLRGARAELLRQYDVVVSMPGPFLTRHDYRSTAALLDMALARRLGIPFVLAGHSVGPLSKSGLLELSRVACCVAREPSTQRFLAGHGIRSVLAADYAFLHPLEAPAGLEDRLVRSTRPYRVLFLRANNLPLRQLRREGHRLLCRGRPVAVLGEDALAVATSDRSKDAAVLAGLANRLGGTPILCTTVAEMVAVIRGSRGVVSDRYHPAVCAIALDRPAQVLDNREAHKMAGLRELIELGDLEGVRNLARTGLRAVERAVVDAMTPAGSRRRSGHAARSTSAPGSWAG
jgi:polysaccharide pyruvyl transferase WcaK-like protein